MEPLERYLGNLSKLLPAAQREDIIRELREDIQSELEDKREELGRALTEQEQIDLLSRRGNPLKVAAAYQQDNRSLAFGREWIGPVLFPFYIRVLTFNLSLTFFIVTIIFAALYIGGQTVHLGDVFSNFLLQIFLQFTAVTVIFSLIERHLSKHPGHWTTQQVRALHLPRIERGKNVREVSRFESVSIIVASTVALIWMQAVWSHLFLIFGPAASFLRLAPIWHQIYWPTVAIVLASILRATVNLIYPRWIRFRAAASVLFDAAGLFLLYVLISAQHYVVLAGEASAQATGKEHMLQVVNQWTYYGLWVSAAVAIAQTVGGLIRFVRTIHGPSAAGI
jgi:hypothetical protein